MACEGFKLPLCSSLVNAANTNWLNQTAAVTLIGLFPLKLILVALRSVVFGGWSHLFSLVS